MLYKAGSIATKQTSKAAVKKANQSQLHFGSEQEDYWTVNKSASQSCLSLVGETNHEIHQPRLLGIQRNKTLLECLQVRGCLCMGRRFREVQIASRVVVVLGTRANDISIYVGDELVESFFITSRRQLTIHWGGNGDWAGCPCIDVGQCKRHCLHSIRAT